MPNPTSVRFTDAETALIAAHAARLEERTGRRHTPTDVIRYLLRQAKPPDGLDPHSSELRRSYRDAFGDQ